MVLTGLPSRVSSTIEKVKLSISRSSILTAIVVAIILAAVPGQIQRLLNTGEPYLFSHLFFEDMLASLSGPGRLRFIAQPAIALFLGIRDGARDERGGSPPFLVALLQKDTQAHFVVECFGIDPRLSRDGDTSGRYFPGSNLPQHPSGCGLVARADANCPTVRHIQGLGESICTEGKPADASRAPALSYAGRRAGPTKGTVGLRLVL
jgi:hypothetical protein